MPIGSTKNETSIMLKHSVCINMKYEYYIPFQLLSLVLYIVQAPSLNTNKKTN